LHIASIVICVPLLTPLAGANGAAAGVVISGFVGGSVSVGLVRRQSIPWRVAAIGKMAAAAAVAGGVAWLLPTPWLVNSLLAVGAFGALSWMTGVLTADDFRTLRRILLTSRPE
ncbi:MAG TPA: hypothetical protein DCL15_04925, partial [Chloroflexi bacterium]|nr:hypothetical protein [Chloroflexota bacterium]